MNKNSDSINLSPVAGWQVAPIAAYEVVMLRLDYLTHVTQHLDQAHQSPNFALTAAQALELSEVLRKHAALAIQGTPGAGTPSH